MSGSSQDGVTDVAFGFRDAREKARTVSGVCSHSVLDMVWDIRHRVYAGAGREALLEQPTSLMHVVALGKGAGGRISEPKVAQIIYPLATRQCARLGIIVRSVPATCPMKLSTHAFLL